MNLKKKMLALYNMLLLLPVTVFAAQDQDFSKEGWELFKDSKPDPKTNASGTFNDILKTLMVVLGFVRTAGIVIAVLMLIYCAIQLASSAGNQQKRAMAMDGIKNVLIATAIIGGAALISQLAMGILSTKVS